MSKLVRDVLACVGFLLVNVGLVFIAWPSVLVFDGLVMIAVGILPALRSGGR